MLFTSVEIRVRYSETDAMGITYHANYLSWFEVARTALFSEIGMSYKKLDDAGFLLPVLEAGMRYIAPSRYDDVLTVTASISEEPRVRIRVDYEVRLAGKVITTGHTVHAFMNRAGQAIRPPQEVRDGFVKAFEAAAAAKTAPAAASAASPAVAALPAASPATACSVTGEICHDLPSPYIPHAGTGLLHLPRFIAKIRKHLAGKLPASYQRNFTKGFDGFLCLHLGVEPPAVIEAVRQNDAAGGDDAALDARLRALFPADVQAAKWNRSLVQRGMSEMGRAALADAKQRMGIANRDDLISFADMIDFDEGRIS
jgi:YbgC/YbaW family acyl-CoA thioester hydrolase